LSFVKKQINSFYYSEKYTISTLTIRFYEEKGRAVAIMGKTALILSSPFSVV